MKALVYTAPHQLTLTQVPDPIPRPGQAILEVIGTGICGSDMSGFLGHSPRRQPPLVLGHEVIGTIKDLPPGNWPFQRGDRVVANPLQSCGECRNCRSGRPNLCPSWTVLGMDQEAGAFAQYVAIDARNVFPIPQHMPNEQAVMIEPLSNAVHLFSLIRQHRFGSLALYGAGTQGILLLSVAQLLGYRDIVVVDTSDARLHIAEHLGAAKVINPGREDAVAAILEWTGGMGADIGIDAVGLSVTRKAVLESVCRGGEILFLGLHDNRSEVEFNAVIRSEQRMQGSFAYTPQDFQHSMRLLEMGEISVEPWTNTQPLETGQAAFIHLTTSPGETLKIILQP